MCIFADVKGSVKVMPSFNIAAFSSTGLSSSTSIGYNFTFASSGNTFPIVTSDDDAILNDETAGTYNGIATPAASGGDPNSVITTSSIPGLAVGDVISSGRWFTLDYTDPSTGLAATLDAFLVFDNTEGTSNLDGTTYVFATETLIDGVDYTVSTIEEDAGVPWFALTSSVAGPDFIVEGTANGDVLTSAFAGDLDGDRIDQNDNQFGNNDDVIYAYGGNDTISALLGDDLIYAGDGDDQMLGGDGDDTIYAGTGDDTVRGNNGDDLIFGEEGIDDIFGGTGADTIDGGDGDDIIDGYTGDDLIDGGAGNDLINGERNNDTIVSSTGTDTIDGGVGQDTYCVPDDGPQNYGYTFVGAELGDNSGVAVATAGDVDGDGLNDVLVTSFLGDSGAADGGEAFLVSGADLAAADAADGTVDGFIDVDNVAPQATSYEFYGNEANDSAGRDVSSIGDIDGDGRDDFMISAFRDDGNQGATYVVSSQDLAAMDAADGTTDGMINLDNVAAQANSYELEGVGLSGISIANAGDVNGDGLDDILVGALSAGGAFYTDGTPNPVGIGGDRVGESYLIASSDLAAADAADGATDGVISLMGSVGVGDTYRFIGEENQDRATFVSSAGDMDGDGTTEVLIGAYNSDAGGTDSGAAYVIDADDMVAADAADGVIDGNIDLSNVAAQPNSYKFIGEDANDWLGEAVGTLDDIDGDGRSELLFGAGGSFGATTGGKAYVLTSQDLAAADAADGSVDGEIDMGNVAAQSGSYKFVGGANQDHLGVAISSAGDIDGDGTDEILIGANYTDTNGSASGSVYLADVDDLAAADAADGAVDGVVNVNNIGDQANSYEFTGAAGNTRAGRAIETAGDVTGDGIDDFLIGAHNASNGGSFSGESYLLDGAYLDEMDAADGTVDGTISLGNVTGVIPGSGPETIDVLVNDDGDSTVDKLGDGTTDTVTSVEHYKAAEADLECDQITMTDVVTDVSTISGIDDNATGMFTPSNGSAPIPFGPTETLQISDLLASGQAGTYAITGGDEDGQVGNISFENFEKINFDVVCFAAGTLISTADGDVKVEDLAEGDFVLTKDKGMQPLRWIGRTTVSGLGRFAPIKIAKGALGNSRDLRVSPQHRMMIEDWRSELLFGADEVLVAAKHLVNGDTIYQEKAQEVEYFHILFDEHEIVFAEGCPSESFHPGAVGLGGMADETRAEILELFPALRNDLNSYGISARISLKAAQASVLVHQNVG